MKRLSLVSTTNIVHTSIKNSITTTETLKASPNLASLLQHSHMITVLCQDTSARQASQSTSYDNTLLHLTRTTFVLS